MISHVTVLTALGESREASTGTTLRVLLSRDQKDTTATRQYG